LVERRQRLFDGSAKRLSWHDAKTQLQRLAEWSLKSPPMLWWIWRRDSASIRPRPFAWC